LATKKFKKTGKVSDFLLKKKAEALSKKVNKKTRDAYWKIECSSISHQTPIGEVWTTVRKMNGNIKEVYSCTNEISWAADFIQINSPLDILHEIDFTTFKDNINQMFSCKFSTTEVVYQISQLKYCLWIR
jgi:hypothetical protein